MAQTANIKRKTAETDIELSFTLYGEGRCDINTGCGFLDHMLTLFAVHGGFDLSVKCEGDTHVDYHHMGLTVSLKNGACTNSIGSLHHGQSEDFEKFDPKGWGVAKGCNTP